ncbi:ComEC/Rec2 family competence protein [Citrobacter amalonaticus]|uniref:ComEC/Rec2 family competence protein n=1 Tax=Citrobacter amalonaticus TaxID=35703 RepID=UPI003D6FF2AC
MIEDYDLDFLAVGDKTSGDAIFVRTFDSIYGANITLIDGGYAGTASNIKDFLSKWYETNTIDNMVLTHGDKDHISGLIKIIEEGDIEVKRLWALFPWDYSQDLIDGNYFENRNSTTWLSHELQRLYPSLKDLEDLAKKNSIPISSPFAGSFIGAFEVLSPSKEFYLDNIASSARTAEENKTRYYGRSLFESVFAKAADFTTTFKEWGYEKFSNESTSPENNNSLVQFATLGSKRVLLTGDAGVEAIGLALNRISNKTIPVADIFQVPHHGSRRNLSSELLDSIIGEKFATQREAEAAETITAVISAGKNDSNHPRKAVVRALYHRGAKIFDTKSGKFHKGTSTRGSWIKAVKLSYPSDIEE